MVWFHFDLIKLSSTIVSVHITREQFSQLKMSKISGIFVSYLHSLISAAWCYVIRPEIVIWEWSVIYLHIYFNNILYSKELNFLFSWCSDLLHLIMCCSCTACIALAGWLDDSEVGFEFLSENSIRKTGNIYKRLSPYIIFPVIWRPT